MTTFKEEQKNQRIAFASTVGLHILIGVLLLFVIAWKAPDPPLSELGGGVELNFGMDDQGYGEVQPLTPVGSERTKEEQPEEQVVEEQPKQEESKPEETKPVEEITSAADKESPVTVKEEKKEEPKKVVEKPVETKKEPEVKKVNPATVFNPDAKKTESTNKTADGKAGSHGDDKGTTGDKGNPEGSLDAKALYGDPGSGGGTGGGDGVSYSGFAGFRVPKIPIPALPDESYGVYEFVVTIDDQGDIISIVSARRGLSIEAERKMKEVIQRLEFIAQGANLPAKSEGRITFKVVSGK